MNDAVGNENYGVGNEKDSVENEMVCKMKDGEENDDGVENLEGWCGK